jgi:hypothetical protein
MERAILIGILIAAVAALVVMLRRSFRRSAETGGCAGCPMSGECERDSPQGDGSSRSESALEGAGTHGSAGPRDDCGKGGTS